MQNIKALSYFSFFNGFRPHWPIAVLYFHEVSGSYAAAMTVYSIVFFSQAVLEVPTGMISDRFGRRRSMIIGAVAATLSISCYALGVGFWLLAVGAVFEGLSRALFSGTDSALLFESLPENDRQPLFQKYSGRINSMSQLALCLSATLCSLLALHSFKLVLWVSVLPQFLSLVSVLFLQNARVSSAPGYSLWHELKEASHHFRLSLKLRLVAIAEILEFGVGEAIFYFQAAFFSTLLPPWALGLARSANHLSGFVGFWFAGPLISRFGARLTLLVGTTAASVVEVFSVLMAATFSPFLMAFMNCTYGPCHTARSALLHEKFSDRQRATMESMVSLSGSILFAIVSALLGYIADTAGPATAILFGLSSNILVIFLYLRIFAAETRPIV